MSTNCHSLLQSRTYASLVSTLLLIRQLPVQAGLVPSSGRRSNQHSYYDLYRPGTFPGHLVSSPCAQETCPEQLHCDARWVKRSPIFITRLKLVVTGSGVNTLLLAYFLQTSDILDGFFFTVVVWVLALAIATPMWFVQKVEVREPMRYYDIIIDVKSGRHTHTHTTAGYHL